MFESVLSTFVAVLGVPLLAFLVLVIALVLITTLAMAVTGWASFRLVRWLIDIYMRSREREYPVYHNPDTSSSEALKPRRSTW